MDHAVGEDGGLVRVWLVGPPPELDVRRLRTSSGDPNAATGFVTSTSATDLGLWERLANERPHVIVTFDDPDQHRELWASPLQVRRRWISAAPGEPHESLAARILATYVTNATTDRFPDQPLVSVITPTYRSGQRIRAAYDSLISQSYQDWEWVLYDDSDDDGETFASLVELAAADPRVRPFRGRGHDGSIGAVKRRACGLAEGPLIVELDHDDRLLPRCLELVVAAAEAHPEAGFFYSDAAEVLDDGSALGYPEGWAFGFGRYRWEEIEGRQLLVQCYPPVNAKTIRHITAAPNHVRAWRAEAYWRSGGHQPDLMVCDDYDLCVRMFLTTRMVHIPVCCYLQIHQGGDRSNTQRTRNREIQRLAASLPRAYDAAIHERLESLGIDDFIWVDESTLDWSREGPPDGAPANLVLAVADRRAGTQPV